MAASLWLSVSVEVPCEVNCTCRVASVIWASRACQGPVWIMRNAPATRIRMMAVTVACFVVLFVCSMRVPSLSVYLLLDHDLDGGRRHCGLKNASFGKFGAIHKKSGRCRNLVIYFFDGAR